MGNSTYPLLENAKGPMKFYCVDYAASAVEILKKNDLFDDSKILGNDRFYPLCLLRFLS